jgi:hypothetical protein
MFIELVNMQFLKLGETANSVPQSCWPTTRLELHERGTFVRLPKASEL